MDTQNISEKIRQLYSEDQAERLAVPWEQIDWSTLRANDRARLQQVESVAKNQEILHRLDGETLYKLAMLFHHSEFDEYVKRAIPIAEFSGRAGYQKGYWLKAAIEDRLLARAGKPQKWGTQFDKNDSGEWRQYELTPDNETGITDEMREKYGVPPRDKQLAVFLESESAT